MSILVVYLVPQGILFAADRNVTVSGKRPVDGIPQVVQWQTRRPKVLKWPDRDAILGYVGTAQIEGEPTDQWLYRRLIGRARAGESLASRVRAVTSELDALMQSKRLPKEPLIVHVAAFEPIEHEQQPAIWFIRNTKAIDTTTSKYVMDDRFTMSEEISEAHFVGQSAAQIRPRLAEHVVAGRPFSFRQGEDLGVFNTLDSAFLAALKVIEAARPSMACLRPESLEGWAKHLAFLVLGYGAYFEGFYEPFEQAVGGGVDMITIPWPGF